MSQENNSLNSYFTWSLVLTLILLAGVFVVKWPVSSQAANDNLASINTVKEWSRESKDLSQIICQESVQPAVSAVKGNQSAVINAARRAYFAGDCESAFAYWTLAAEQDPHDETAAIMQFLSSGLNREMLADSLSNEDMATLLFGLGSQAEQNEMDEEAQYWFASAFDLHPSVSTATRINRYRESAEQKKQVWQRLSEVLTEDDAHYWWALGNLTELNGEWERAKKAYGAGAAISPDPFLFLMRQGSMMLRLDQSAEAAEVFKEAASLKPYRSQPYLRLGGIVSEAGDHATANLWYKRAVEAEPGEYQPNYFLGLNYYRLQDHELAEQYLRKAVEIEPQNSSALYYLAQTIYATGRRELALANLEDAVLLDEGSNVEWLVLLGDWREATNDCEGALEVYYQALDLQPDRADIIGKIQKIEND